MAMWQDDGGLFGQSQMRKSMGAGAPAPTPFVEPKRNRQDPAPKGYSGSGLEDNGPIGADVGFGGFGGAGGPMPIPDGGPGWHRGFMGGDQTGGGGGPMPIPDRGDQNGGGGGPMPMPPPWGRNGNPEDYGVTMEFGGPGAINPPGMGPQGLRDLYNPQPVQAPFMESKRYDTSTPAPKGYGGSGLGEYGNTGIVPPHLGGGLWDSVQFGGGGPMPMPPKGGGGQSGYMGGPRVQGGPYGPPHPQGGPPVDQMGGAGGPMPMGPGRGLWGPGGQRGQFPQNIDPNLLRYLLMRRG